VAFEAVNRELPSGGLRGGKRRVVWF